MTNRWIVKCCLLVFVGVAWGDWIGSTSSAQEASPQNDLKWKISQPIPETSLRGLHVVDRKTVWACGSGGTVVRTSDGGESWLVASPPNWPKLEFRSIHAWDAKRACIASAGTPAILLRTLDGGENWSEVYRHPSELAFFDAMQFWTEQDGIAISDPIEGHWVIVQTSDGGKSWRAWSESETPQVLSNEAAFAASNGSLYVRSDKEFWIGSGGAVEGSEAGVYRVSSNGKWNREVAKLRSDKSSGIFGLIVNQKGFGVAVGGNYEKEAEPESTASWSVDGGLSWSPAKRMPSGFRSSVVVAQMDGRETWIAAGPNGIDRSLDGREWKRIGETGFHAIRWEPESQTLWGVGSKGRIGSVRLSGASR